MNNDKLENCHGIISGLAHDFNDDEKTQIYKDPIVNEKIDVFTTGMATDSESVNNLCGIHGDATRTLLNDKRPNPWFAVDFKDNCVEPTHYSLRHYSSKDIECIRNWEFRGSNDGENWETIKQHKNDKTFQRKGQIATFKVECNKKYRYFRIYMTEKNENGHWYLCCSGLEIYGLIVGDVGFGGAPPKVASINKPKIEKPKWPKIFTCKSDFDKNGLYMVSH